MSRTYLFGLLCFLFTIEISFSLDLTRMSQTGSFHSLSLLSLKAAKQHVTRIAAAALVSSIFIHPNPSLALSTGTVETKIFENKFYHTSLKYPAGIIICDGINACAIHISL